MYSIEGVVVFQDSDNPHWLIKYLKPGFRHCYVAIKQDDLWVKIDPVNSCTIVEIYENMTIKAEKDVKIVHFKVETSEKVYRGGFCWFNCVEVVKAHIGIKSFWTWTPWQLYKLLEKKMTKLDVSSGARFGEFRSGKSKKARKAAQAQQRQIDLQRQKEESRLAESEGEVAKRKAMAKGKGAGRSLLTATSPTGVNNLGG